MCKAKWRCESCGFCMDCWAGIPCPITKLHHKRPEPKTFINRVQKKARGTKRAPMRAQAPRNLAKAYVDRQLSFASIANEPRNESEILVLPIGRNHKKGGLSA